MGSFAEPSTGCGERATTNGDVHKETKEYCYYNYCALTNLKASTALKKLWQCEK